MVACHHCGKQLQVIPPPSGASPQFGTVTATPPVLEPVGPLLWQSPNGGDDDLPGRRGKGNKTARVSGLVLGLSIGGAALALIGVIVLAAVLMSGRGDDGEQASTDDQPVNPLLKSPEPAKPSQPPEPAKPSQPPVPSWAPPTKAVRQADLEVRIVKATIGRVPLKDAFSAPDEHRGKPWFCDSVSDDKLLMVKLKLVNVNPGKKMEYHSWTGRVDSFDRNTPTLKDNYGNSYRLAKFNLGNIPVGAVERIESLYPNKPQDDVVVFEAPLDTATHLDLELPATNYGGEGMIRFRIPMKGVRSSTARDVKEKEQRMQAIQSERSELKKLTQAETDPRKQLKLLKRSLELLKEHERLAALLSGRIQQ
jgi:hypothetical protein